MRMQTTRNLSRKKILVFTIIALICGGCFSLIFMEFILRFFLGPVSHEITNAHPIFHHFSGNNPDANSLGFYDREYAKEKPSGVYRIMILGDSLVRRSAGSANFPKLLENHLAETNTTTQIEVWNCGIDSYSPALEYLLLRHKLLECKPDLVIACIFMGNDFNDDAVYQAKMVFDESGKPLRCPPDGRDTESRLVPGQLRIPFKNYLRFHSRLYRELSRAYNQLLHQTGVRKGEWGKAQIDADQTAPIGTITVNITDAVFDILTQNVLRLNELLEEHHCAFWAMLIPLDAQVDGIPESPNPSAAAPREDLRIADQNETRLAAFLEERKIPTIDLLPWLKAKNTHPLYIPGSHFNEAGHHAVAEILYEEIKTRTDLLSR